MYYGNFDNIAHSYRIKDNYSNWQSQKYRKKHIGGTKIIIYVLFKQSCLFN